MRRVLIPQNLQTLPPQLPKGEQHTLTGQSMGTTWTVRFINTYQQSDDVVRALIQRELDLVVEQMSTWQENSNLSIFNRADANTWHVLPADFFKVLDCALKIAAETDGAFDPTIGPLVNLWGFGPDGQRTSPPDVIEVKALHAYCGWQKLQLDKDGMRALQPGNVYVDFSGIAKGYSVDRVAHALQEAGIANYLIEVGGELYGAGIKPDGQPWWIALETSPDASSVTESVVALHGLAVATSGDYRRYFEHHG
jgi:FAD:protein FMN transferase